MDSSMWLLGIGLVGILAVFIWMGFLTQDKDKGADIKLQLGIIASVTGVLLFIFGIAAYMYFTANVNYLTPFLLITTFLNMFMSIFAIAASTIQLTA